MRKPVKHLLCSMIGWFILLNPLQCWTQDISYHLQIDERYWNSFHVRILVENINQPQLVFVMPVWRPGAYVRGDFGQYVQNFEVVGEAAQPLQTIRLNQESWSVDVDNSSFISVEYEVDHTSPRFMGLCLDSTFALVDGAMNFMYVKDKENSPLTVNFRVPHGWKLATGLPSAQSSFEFLAQNYDHLIDCPVLMSKFTEYYFTLKNHPFYVILEGRQRFDINYFLRMIKKIVSYQTEYFGEIPFEKYLFLFNISSKGKGGCGLEHRNSTYIKLSSHFIRQNIKSVFNIIAHEFFHCWNVKRIHPEILGPFNYTKRARTKNLWFCEGVTSYYADLTLIRTKIWSEQEFLQRQAKLIERLQQNPDRLVTSLEKASLETWERGYRSHGISYYNKGQLVGMLLDLTIREVSNNNRCLDDLLKFMNWWFAKKGLGYKEDDILRALNAIVDYDFTDFFNKYVSGTVELPYKEIFYYAGILADIKKDTVPDLGLLRTVGSKNKVIVIDEAGPLVKAGLKRGDYLYAINGQTIGNMDDIPQIVESLKIGSEIQLTAERQGVQLNLYATVDKKAEMTAQLTFLQDPSERQLKIRQSWLEGSN